MKYSNDWVLREGKDDFLFFWGSDHNSPEGCYSQWYPSPFKVGGAEYPTAEHWMMAKKALLFGDGEMFKRIMATPFPDLAKKCGRLIRGFDANLWDKEKYNIVLEGNLYKFSNSKLAKRLQASGDKVIVEASPYDKIWGIGMDVQHEDVRNPSLWQGENLLGYVLMEVRDMLRVTANKAATTEALT